MKYITTPIYYVNAAPHIGHAVTTLAADVLARFWRLRGEETFFLTGTDEHGAKIAEAAEAAGEEPQAFVDSVSATFQTSWNNLSIQPDGFIRTTDSRHKTYVQQFLQELYNKGEIIKGEYKGWYCTGCEEFKTESQIGENNTCPIHLSPLKEVAEETYLFRLSRYQDQITQLIESDTLQILPKERKNEVLAFIREGLRDVAISRKNVAWGVPLPWDESHTVYVWVDALLNYLSAEDVSGPDFNGVKPVWPPALQLIGKDILRFHAVIWPGLLLAAGKSLPKQLFVHGFFTVEGHKMSKSLGNVIAPEQVIERYGVDGARYVLLAAVPFGLDGDMSWDRLDSIYNSDLANNLGNLVNRVQSMIGRYRDGVVPSNVTNPVSLDHIQKTGEVFAEYLESVDLSKAIELLKAHAAQFNVYIEQSKPWELAKTDQEELDRVLLNLAENLYGLAILVAPFLPNASQKILSIFGTSTAEAQYDTLGKSNTAGKTVTPIEPLFPRLEV